MNEKIVDFETEHFQAPWKRVYYETSDGGGRFWENYKNRYFSRNEKQIARMLIEAGLSPGLSKEEIKEGRRLNEVEEAIRTIETQHVVDRAGAFSGWHAGHHYISGHSVLVTETAKIVQPKEPKEGVPGLPEALPVGDYCQGWPNLGEFYNTRFASHEKDCLNQMITWAAVLRRCYEAMVAGQPLRCQAMVFAGDPSAGKSLNFSIMTHILGGRSYKPLRYLMGRSEFNKGMLYAPILIVDDEGFDTKIASRKMLTANVKQIVATPSLSCHGKGKDEFDIMTQRIICFAVNLEQDNLMVLPPMDKDVEGKIHLFRFYHPETWPWPEQWSEERIWDLIEREIPYFLHWLLNDFELPEGLYEQRFGVVPYHHKEVMEGLDFLSPENRVLGFIERTALKESGRWSGTAQELEQEMKDSEALTFEEKRKIPSANPLLGKYLTRLSEKPKFKGRFIQRRVGKERRRIWILLSAEQLNERNRDRNTQSNSGIPEKQEDLFENGGVE